MLRSPRVSLIRLTTSNPGKVTILSRHGIDVVAQLPLQVGHTALNAQYLATKAAKSGHLL